MTQIVHARSAELRHPAYMRETVLVAASIYGDKFGARYVTGRATLRGTALLDREVHTNYRAMVATYQLMAAVHLAEPEAHFQKHPQMVPVPVTIHLRDDATILVSAVERPCQRFWVSTQDVFEAQRRA